jgi:hypothetical protein
LGFRMVPVRSRLPKAGAGAGGAALGPGLTGSLTRAGSGTRHGQINASVFHWCNVMQSSSVVALGPHKFWAEQDTFPVEHTVVVLPAFVRPRRRSGILFRGFGDARRSPHSGFPCMGGFRCCCQESISRSRFFHPPVCSRSGLSFWDGRGSIVHAA